MEKIPFIPDPLYSLDQDKNTKLTIKSNKMLV